MEIREFERAFRAALGSDFTQPALAVPGIIGRIDLQLPTEFQTAARTLASRSGSHAQGDSLLRATAAQWT